MDCSRQKQQSAVCAGDGRSAVCAASVHVSLPLLMGCHPPPSLPVLARCVTTSPQTCASSRMPASEREGREQRACCRLLRRSCALLGRRRRRPTLTYAPPPPPPPPFPIHPGGSCPLSAPTCTSACSASSRRWHTTSARCWTQVRQAGLGGGVGPRLGWVLGWQVGEEPLCGGGSLLAWRCCSCHPFHARTHCPHTPCPLSQPPATTLSPPSSTHSPSGKRWK